MVKNSMKEPSRIYAYIDNKGMINYSMTSETEDANYCTTIFIHPTSGAMFKGTFKFPNKPECGINKIEENIVEPGDGFTYVQIKKCKGEFDYEESCYAMCEGITQKIGNEIFEAQLFAWGKVKDRLEEIDDEKLKQKKEKLDQILSEVSNKGEELGYKTLKVPEENVEEAMKEMLVEEDIAIVHGEIYYMSAAM